MVHVSDQTDKTYKKCKKIIKEHDSGSAHDPWCFFFYVRHPFPGGLKADLHATVVLVPAAPELGIAVRPRNNCCTRPQVQQEEMLSSAPSTTEERLYDASAHFYVFRTHS